MKPARPSRLMWSILLVAMLAAVANYSIADVNQSRMTNIGSTDTMYHLFMKTQYYNTTLSAWVDDDIVINETTAERLNATDISKLDAEWNQRDYTTANLSFGYGWYRIVMYGLDNESNAIRNIDGSEINATWNFSYAANQAPLIADITPIADVEITESGVTYVEFNVTATDPDGVAGLDDSSLNVSFSMAGEATRRNQSCTWLNDLNSTSAMYTCTVGVWYFDSSGWWSVNATIKDTDSLQSSMYNESFFVMETTAMTASPQMLTWPQLFPGNTDSMANENIEINNTGNDDIDTGNVRIMAFDLVGETDNSYRILAGNFSASTLAACGGTVLANNTLVNIAGSVLPAGNNSAGLGQETLHVCMEEVAFGLLSQDYSAESMWVIDVI